MSELKLILTHNIRNIIDCQPLNIQFAKLSRLHRAYLIVGWLEVAGTLRHDGILIGINIGNVIGGLTLIVHLLLGVSNDFSNIFDIFTSFVRATGLIIILIMLLAIQIERLPLKIGIV